MFYLLKLIENNSGLTFFEIKNIPSNLKILQILKKNKLFRVNLIKVFINKLNVNKILKTNYLNINKNHKITCPDIIPCY